MLVSTTVILSHLRRLAERLFVFQTHEHAKSAVALLVGTELWGFISPSTVDLSLVRDATAKIQAYHAVPTQYLAIDEFPTTKNGKVDKRALVVFAEGQFCEGARRFSAPSRSGSASP
jgi:acyl-coenzyme A synthetase/AMP-(fatty) acid ligase